MYSQATATRGKVISRSPSRHCTGGPSARGEGHPPPPSPPLHGGAQGGEESVLGVLHEDQIAGVMHDPAHVGVHELHLPAITDLVHGPPRRAVAVMVL